MQILANIFVVMPLEFSHYSVAGISKLPLWIETDMSPTSKHWYDECFFLWMKPEYSVMQNSAMPHLYKWAIADVWSGKNIPENLICKKHRIFTGI